MAIKRIGGSRGWMADNRTPRRRRCCRRTAGRRRSLQHRHSVDSLCRRRRSSGPATEGVHRNYGSARAARGRNRPLQVVITTIDTKSPVSQRSRADCAGLCHQESHNPGISRWWAIGADAAGAMYGGLELAEAIADRGQSRRASSTVRSIRASPQRGIKFNIPLDARTPSYSDDSTSAQANIAEMWSMDFWTPFLDEMARHRYNLLSLWSLSPFPSLVKVPEYPRVALADVKRKTGRALGRHAPGPPDVRPSWPLETVKVMTIDEKIAFWRAVMEHARDRGVERRASSPGTRSSTAPRRAATASPTRSTTRRRATTFASPCARSSTPIRC